MVLHKRSVGQLPGQLHPHVGVRAGLSTARSTPAQSLALQLQWNDKTEYCVNSSLASVLVDKVPQLCYLLS